MLVIVHCGFLLFASQHSSAETQPSIKVGVVSIKIAESTGENADSLVEAVEREFLHAPLFSVTPANELSQQFGRSLLQLQGCESASLRHRLRREFDIEYVVCGTIEDAHSKNIITLTMTKTQTGLKSSEIRQGCRRCNSQQLHQAVSQVARAMMRKFLDENRVALGSRFPDISIDTVIDMLRSGRTGFQPSGQVESIDSAEHLSSSSQEDAMQTAGVNPSESSETGIGGNSNQQLIPTATPVQQSTIGLPESADVLKENQTSVQSAPETSESSPAHKISVLDFQQASQKYREKRQSILLFLFVLLFCIIVGIIVLNIYRRKRLEVSSSSLITTFAELEESEQPAGILRCTIRKENLELDTLFFAPPIIVVGHDPYESFDVQKPHCNIGSGSSATEIMQRLSLIDRRHAKIDFSARSVGLTDLGSQNGTFVNNQRLEPGERNELQEGDMVGFAGAISFRIEIHTSPRSGIASIYLIPADSTSSARTTYVLLLQECFFSVGVQSSFEWRSTESDDSLFKLFFKGRNFWIESLTKYPPIVLDSERMGEHSRRRLDRLHSTMEIHNTHILIDDLTTTL